MNIPFQQYWSTLIVYLKPQRRRVSLLAVVLLSSIALQLVNPQIVRYFIDSARAGETMEHLLQAALSFLLVGLATQALSIWAAYIGADVGWNATNLLREDLARHCLDLDMPFHNNRTPGELIERIDGDVTALSNFFSQFVIRILGSSLLLLGALVLLYREDWRAGGVMTLFVIGTLFVLQRFQNIAVPSTTAEREATATLYGFLEERISGLDDVRANGGGFFVMRRFFEISRELFRISRKSQMMRMMLWVIIIGFFSLGEVAALGMGAYLFRLGAISIGTVLLFFQYTEILQGPLEQISMELQDMQKAGASIGRVYELLNIKREMADGTRGLPVNKPLAVDFDGVTFAYGDGAPVLHDLSFSVEAGTVLGLLGRTGSGKSSITRLLFRLYDPVAGSVRIGGVDLRGVRMSDLRKRVAMVTQDVQLFHASVRDNLTFFDPTIADNRILEVIYDLGLDGWYERLGEGLDTELKGQGGGLSAGEAQLLAFTRIFLKDPGVVVLDEPSSRMDMATEALIERAMQKLLTGRTAIIIAHRLSTVSRADRIMILDHGRVREEGERADLVADPGSHFNHLLRAGLEKELS